MLDYIKARCSEPSTWLGLMLGAAEVIKFFTPNDIDVIVDSFVSAVSALMIFSPNKK